MAGAEALNAMRETERAVVDIRATPDPSRAAVMAPAEVEQRGRGNAEDVRDRADRHARDAQRGPAAGDGERDGTAHSRPTGRAATLRLPRRPQRQRDHARDMTVRLVRPTRSAAPAPPRRRFRAMLSMRPVSVAAYFAISRLVPFTIYRHDRIHAIPGHLAARMRGFASQPAGNSPCPNARSRLHRRRARRDRPHAGCGCGCQFEVEKPVEG